MSIHSDTPTRSRRASRRALGLAAVMALGMNGAQTAPPGEWSPADAPVAPQHKLASNSPAVLRAAHWNVWMYPDIAHTNDAGLDNNLRVGPITRILKRQQYDIVSINELFAGSPDQKGQYDEFIYGMTGLTDGYGYNVSAQDVSAFVRRANQTMGPFGSSQPYPFFIWSPGFEFTTKGDAGLAFFSRFPALPRTDLPPVAVDGSATPRPPGIFADYVCLTQIGEGVYENIYVAPTPSNPGPFVHGGSDFWFKSNMDPTSAGCPAAYTWYRASGGADSNAVKGALWVRVSNPKTGRPLNVFVTHLQADYPEEHPPQDWSPVRELQHRHLLDFVKSMALPNEDVMLLGDLNVLGDGGRFVSNALTNTSEYSTIIGQRYETLHGLEDSYRRQMRPSDDDPGFTRDESNVHNAIDPHPQRLDYMLTRFPGYWNNNGWESRYCNQHVRVRRDFLVESGVGAGTPPSDHYPVELTVAVDEGYCSPAKAADGDLPAGTSARTFTLKFSQPGAVQWISVPANRDFALMSGPLLAQDGNAYKLDVTAFSTKDLSMPVTIYNEKYSIGDGAEDLREGVKMTFPFDAYIRVTPQKYGALGTVDVTLQEMDGLTPDTALILRPGGFDTSAPKGNNADYNTLWSDRWTRHTLMPGSQLNGTPGQKVKWFEYKAPSDAPEALCFDLRVLKGRNSPVLAGAPTASRYRIRVQTEDERVLLDWTPYSRTQSESGSHPGMVHYSCAKGTGLPFKGLELKIGLEREFSADDEDIRVAMTPNLVLARFAKLMIRKQADWGATSGADEPVARLLRTSVSPELGGEIRLKSVDRYSGVDEWAYFWEKGIQIQQVYDGLYVDAGGIFWMVGEESCTFCATNEWHDRSIKWLLPDWANTYGVTWRTAPWGISRHSHQLDGSVTMTGQRKLDLNTQQVDVHEEYAESDGPSWGHYTLMLNFQFPGAVTTQ
jgi:hypothetical protein